MSNRITTKLSLLAAVALTLSGCGDYETTLPTDYTYAPVVKPIMRGGDPLQIPLRKDPYTVAGQFTKLRNPLLGQKNPMLGDTSKAGNPMAAAGADPMNTKFSTDGTERPTYGRYVLDGDITSGEVEIQVNGTPVGKFSSHVDEDVTQWCRNGENTVTFIHHPSGNGQQLSSVHIQLFNKEKPSNPITLTYDTATAANDAPINQSSPVATSPGLATPSIPQPGIDQSNTNISSEDTSFTDERIFTDDSKSYEALPGSK